MSRVVEGVLAGPALDTRELILASASTAREAVLEHAGLSFHCEAAAVDESEVKSSLKGEHGETYRGAVALAETLAELKAVRISRKSPEALVIGADQVLECDGKWFDKPDDTAAARATLLKLRGKSHRLISGVCVALDGECLWRHVDHATLLMRPFSDAFLDRYLDAVGARALGSVGAYQVEGPGAQLFARIDGDYFTILGLPLLPLLEFLRGHGVVPA